MDPLNLVMNKVDGWTQKEDENGVQQNWAKRHLLTRGVTVVVGVPSEIYSVAKNIITAPISAAGMALKLVVKTLRVCSSSLSLKQLDEALPGPIDFLKTVLKVVAYAIGTLYTATLGFISPTANFKLHASVPFLNLVTNVRESKIQAEWVRKQEAELLKRAEEEAQAEEILAAVAAMLEKAELEAEREEKLATAKLIKNMEEEVKAEAKAAKEIEEIVQPVPQEVAKKEPNFFQRLFGYSNPEGTQPKVEAV